MQALRRLQLNARVLARPHKYLSQPFHRRFSVEADDLRNKGPWILQDFVSPTSAKHLDATLTGYLSEKASFEHLDSSNGGITRSINDKLPAGYHLIYFNPQNPESKLSSDGYDDHQSPGPRYPARMWLGGQVEFNNRTSLLMGTPSTCVETIPNVVYSAKEGADGKLSERVVVTIERGMKNDQDTLNDWAVKETRKLIYFNQESGGDRTKTFTRFIKPPTNKKHSHLLTPSATMLYRYSALTFNGHKIHFDPQYCIQHEHLPGIIVHGPLTLSLLLRWTETFLIPSEQPGLSIKSFNYRNILPMFANDSLSLCSSGLNSSKNSLEVWVENHKGSMTVSGTIELE